MYTAISIPKFSEFPAGQYWIDSKWLTLQLGLSKLKRTSPLRVRWGLMSGPKPFRPNDFWLTFTFAFVICCSRHFVCFQSHCFWWIPGFGPILKSQHFTVNAKLLIASIPIDQYVFMIYYDLLTANDIPGVVHNNETHRFSTFFHHVIPVMVSKCF